MWFFYVLNCQNTRFLQLACSLDFSENKFNGRHLEGSKIFFFLIFQGNSGLSPKNALLEGFRYKNDMFKFLVVLLVFPDSFSVRIGVHRFFALLTYLDTIFSVRHSSLYYQYLLTSAQLFL